MSRTPRNDQVVIDAVVSTEAKAALEKLAAEDSAAQGSKVDPADLIREALADYFKRRGVQARVEIDEGDALDPREALREALRDVKAGRVYPVEALWEDDTDA
jgi:DNA invertase Pin-like site-specific DNA recombinase